MLSQYFLCGKEHVCDLDLNNLVSKLLIEQLNIKKKNNSICVELSIRIFLSSYCILSFI